MTKKQEKKIRAIALIGASGSGKSTVEAALTGGRARGVNPLDEEIVSGYRKIVSHTTRPMREGEKDGVDYFYVSPETFKRIPMVESVVFGGNHYGVSVEQIELDDRFPVVVVEPHGAQQLIEYYGREHILVVYFDIPEAIRVEGMRARGDTEEMIRERLAVDDIAQRFKESGLCPDLRIRRLSPDLPLHLHRWIEIYQEFI